ncbi:MAG TPA: DUF4386 domain-containing protein, partial [Candidatus Limnocylindrales bacterium]|nr:DUF4386 domain-containing protein [Candidatus Limnocylindrales bacterium]
FGQMVVFGSLLARDPATTAANILANESFFRLGVAASLIAVVLHVAWGYLLYELLKFVNAAVARFSLVLLVVGAAVQAVTALMAVGALSTLLAGDTLTGFGADQRNALAQIFMRLNAQSNNVFLALFGFWLVTIGYLVFRSTFVPRLIGLALVIEGIGWTFYVWPPVGVALFPAIAFFGIFGELALTGWLLIRGVDPDRWRAVEAASRLTTEPVS